MEDKLKLYRVCCNVKHPALGTLTMDGKNILATSVEEAVRKAKGSYPYGGAEAQTITVLGDVDVA